MTIRAIDMCGVAYDDASWEAYLRRFAEVAPRYLVVFARPLARLTGLDSTTVQQRAHDDPHGAVDLLAGTGRLGVAIDDHVAELASTGVLHQVVHGQPPFRGHSTNERIAALAAAHPDTLSAWIGVHLGDPDAAVEEIRRGVAAGMSGVTLIPFLDGVDPASARCEPVFQTAEQLALPVWIHTGQNFANHGPLDATGWRHLDAIASRHPELVVVAGHGGWPFVLELVALCQRHPNVYIELSSHPGRVIAAPGSGWEPLLLHGRTTIRHKVLFGSSAWVHGRSVADLAAELADAAPDVASAWLHDNAQALLARAGRVAA